MERNRNSLKHIFTRIILALIVIAVLLCATVARTQANDSLAPSLPTFIEEIFTGSSSKEEIIPESTEEIIDLDAVLSEVVEIIEYNEYFTSQEVANAIIEIDEYCDRLQVTMNEYGELTSILQKEMERVQKIKVQYEEDYTNLKMEEDKWAEREAEYPEATFIWLYMRNEFQWSPEVCAGIMGNMMSECGGQTLKGLSNWDADGNSGYGLIQWIGGRRKAIEAKYGSHPSIEEQLIFMKDEMFGTNGVTNQLYIAGWLEAIMNSKTPEQAAARFACYFERPASTYYGVRQRNARVAYNYFVD